MPCNSIITELEVLRAHTITSRNLSGKLCRRTDCEEHRRYDVIDLKNNKNVTILDREISWEFLKNSKLFGTTGTGKVAKLGNIRIKENQKATGIGKDIHAQQLSVFSNNQFKEIQLSAKWDGVIAWPSLFFQFKNDEDEDELIEHISTYMLDVLRYNSERVKKIMHNYDGIQSVSQHLKPTSKIWFTKWYQETDRALQYQMYKEVS